jgi:putative ABC transport system permease protein
MNATVVIFTLALSVVTGVVFGLVPAFQAAGGTPLQALRTGGRGGSGSRGGRRLRAGLVVAEISLAVVLLTGAGLLMRSFVKIWRAAEASAAEPAVTLRFSLQGDAYQGADSVRARVGEILAGVRALPGVTAVAGSTVVPLGTRGNMIGFQVDGGAPPPANVNMEIAAASVTPDYFMAIGAPIRRGRGLTDQDAQDRPRVGVLNEAAVRRWFPTEEAVGKFVLANGTRVEVVGVVADTRMRDVREPAAPQLFMPFAQRTTRTVRVIVKTANDPMSHMPAIRDVFRSIDPNIAIAAVMPFSGLVADSIARPRFYTSMLAIFAAVALVLAAIGVFGVMNYAVSQRLREISIRMALGAHAGGVLRMIVGQALTLAAAGGLVGIIAALALGRAIQNQLFGVTTSDPITLVSVIGVLITSAAFASFLPAWRAASLDPAGVLRQG